MSFSSQIIAGLFMSNPRRILPLLLAAGFSVLPISEALSQDFGAWRALTAEEEKARAENSPSVELDPTTIEADFNGDGKTDTALIAVRLSDQARELIVDMNGHTHVLIHVEEGEERIGPDDGLGLAEPRRWETICGNAFRKLQGGLCESEGYPKAVTLKNPGFLYISPGQTNLYFWDRKKKTFDLVVLRN